MQHFISYSPTDGLPFALWLHNSLRTSSPPFNVWLDKDRLRAGFDWEAELERALSVCDSVLYVMTPASVNRQSFCRMEIRRASEEGKLVVPLAFHPDARPPLQLELIQRLDFAGDREPALDKLRELLGWLQTPEGQAALLRNRLQDVERKLLTADAPGRRSALRDQAAQLQQGLADRDRTPESAARPVPSVLEVPAVAEPIRFPYPLPDPGPDYFQDRGEQTAIVESFLRSDAVRLVMVVGRAGIGKTATVCRLLQRLRDGESLTDGRVDLDAVVWLDARDRPLGATALLAELSQLVSATNAPHLDRMLRSSLTPDVKLDMVVTELRDAAVLVVIDGFETLVDLTTLQIRESELDELLRALLLRSQHGIKVILITRAPPQSLLRLRHPSRRRQLELEGLDSPHAENLLREMDPDGVLGLRNAHDTLLGRVRELTEGRPRALEAFVAILDADRDTTPLDLLDRTADKLPDDVTAALIGEAVEILDEPATLVLQGLAVFGRPVSPEALDRLLAPWMHGEPSHPVLGRLVNLRLIRKRDGGYLLPAADREIVLAGISSGDPADKAASPPPFTQVVLFHRGAELCAKQRLPEAERHALKDLDPQLIELDLRLRAGEYDQAFYVLREIDHRHLLPWGQAQVVLEGYRKLEGKLQDRALEYARLGMIGTALRNLGDPMQAIEHYQAALAITEELSRPRGQKRWLTNLGSASYELGRTRRAVDYYQRALAIAEGLDDPGEQASPLAGLCLCLGDIGQFDRAVDLHQRALRTARDTGDRRLEAEQLANLGYFQGLRGPPEAALQALDDALELATAIGNQTVMGHCLADGAEALVDQDRLPAAIDRASQAVRIGTEIGDPLLARDAYHALALAHLLSGDGSLPKARAAVDMACQLGSRQLRSHVAFALKGVVAIRQDDRDGAFDGFGAALGQADKILDEDEQSFAALDSRGLALAGLAILHRRSPPQAALTAYRTARSLASEEGLVARTLRRLDELAPVDRMGIVKVIRPVAAGEAQAGDPAPP